MPGRGTDVPVLLSFFSLFGVGAGSVLSFSFSFALSFSLLLRCSGCCCWVADAGRGAVAVACVGAWVVNEEACLLGSPVVGRPGEGTVEAGMPKRLDLGEVKAKNK